MFLFDSSRAATQTWINSLAAGHICSKGIFAWAYNQSAYQFVQAVHPSQESLTTMEQICFNSSMQ